MVEIFIQLSVDFADDPKVRALSRFGRSARTARDLYVQMLCYCKRTKSDGYVPAEQIGVLVFPDGGPTARKDLEALVAVMLVEQHGKDWFIPGYLKRNKSRSRIEQDRQEKEEAGARGNHNRWHAGRGVTDPKCVLCRTTESHPDRTTESVSDPTSDVDRSSIESPETETETETQLRPIAPSDRTEHDPKFDEFWAAYPRRVGKPSARKAWLAAMRRHDDPDTIIAAATAYRDDPRRKPEFTKHPGPWLNDARYDDPPAITAARSNGTAWWDN